MKKNLFFAILGFNTIVAQNLVNNGDFEGWNPSNNYPTYWQFSPTNTSTPGYCHKYSGSGVNGTFACKLPIMPPQNSSGSISQFINNINGRYTKVAFRYLFPQIATGKSFMVNLVRSDNYTVSSTVNSSNLGSWQNFSVIFPTNSYFNYSGYDLHIHIIGSDVNNLSPYIVIDDVQVISSNNLSQLSVIENPLLKNIKILNPIKDKLHIDTNEKIEKIEIRNINGQLSKVLCVNENNISDLSTGIYLLTIYTEKGVFTKKIIKE